MMNLPNAEFPDVTGTEHHISVHDRDAKKKSRRLMGGIFGAGVVVGIAISGGAASQGLHMLEVGASMSEANQANRTLHGKGFPSLIPQHACMLPFEPPHPELTLEPQNNDSRDILLDKLGAVEIALSHLSRSREWLDAPVRERPFVLSVINRQVVADCYFQLAGYYIGRLQQARTQYRAALGVTR